MALMGSSRSLSLEGVIPQSKRLGMSMEGEMRINGSGWKYSPLMAKWKRGLKVREQEKVVWWGSYKHKNGTGQAHKMNKSSLAKRELMKREALPCMAQNLDR
ncbi:hypothetical protein NQZ68_034278 [Dissostichus eleginoides]|nr:hypothetical protein NQZ68_034278 [Dissostichus eleginoides]